MSDDTAKPAESWDAEAVYDERIFPLMAQVIAICKEHRIPMVASFAYARDEDDTSSCTTFLPFDGRRVEAFVEAQRAIRARRSVVALTITTSAARSPRSGEERER